MQSNFRRDYNHRSSTSIQNSGRIGRTTRFEYVNRAGEPVSPTTGKPYSRTSNSGFSENNNKRNKRPLPIKKSGAMFSGLEPIPTDVTRDPPPRACFNCWQLGHARRNCARPTVVRMCNNCGRRGEDLHTCPRCSHAHQRYLERLNAKERGEEVEQMVPPSSEEEDTDVDEFLRNLSCQEQELRNLAVFLGNNRELFGRDQENYSLYQERENKFVAPEREREQVQEISYPERPALEAIDTANDKRRSESSSRIYVRRTTATTSSSNLASSDPVQEILLLTKSIAHLSPETQDLIMRQVMTERKEKAHQRALQGHHEDTWP